jgi:hypothetical protein
MVPRTRTIRAIPAYFLLAFMLLISQPALGMELSGKILISYSNGTSEYAANQHVLAVDKQEMDTYLTPLLFDAQEREGQLKVKWQVHSENYNPGGTDAEVNAYKKKDKELFEAFTGILPDLIAGYRGKILASAITDSSGTYRLNVTGEFYIVVDTMADDDGTYVPYVWLVPSNEIPGNILILDQQNAVPSVATQCASHGTS